MTFFRTLLAVTVLLFSAVSAHSQAVPGQGTWQDTLQARDVGNTGTTNAFYDTALNITWLDIADGNIARNWADAHDWVNNLNVGGIGGWRLPMMADGSAVFAFGNQAANGGYTVPANFTTEISNLLFSTLGNQSYVNAGGGTQYTNGLTNTGGFKNLGPYIYWTGMDYTPAPYYGVYFNVSVGSHTIYDKGIPAYAMAVHNGDVALVPEPETYAMLLAGLGVTGAVARRRHSDKTSVAQS